MHANKEVITALVPLRFVAVVRCSWENMTSRIGALIASLRLESPDIEVNA